MSAEILKSISQKELAAHVQVCFSTPSGEIVYELLRKLCFMAPTLAPESVESAEQASSRLGLVNLFRRLEYFRSPTSTFKENL
ncbi:MAG: hypothetical protein Q8O00_11250 [Holophaga sp.]|nr:hypothetical protein [Holophaga sp.]